MGVPKTIKIDDVEYVKTTDLHKKAELRDGMEYVICRTYSAGVFAGYLESRNGQEVVLRDARRLWKWSGAASLSQLAVDGVKNPKDCWFPCEVDQVELLQAIEILSCTAAAKKSISEVPIWEM